MELQWFPGHMTKSFRDIEENLKRIDIAFCVLDARAPYSCLNPELEKKFNNKPIVYLINKTGLADDESTKVWVSWFKSKNNNAYIIDATKPSAKKIIQSCVKEILAVKYAREERRQIKLTTRIAIVGVPNTGKSTLINSLAGTYAVKTGNLAGVTRSSSWVKIADGIEVMDNAGTLYPKFKNDTIAENLAFIGSISDNAVDITELSNALVAKLTKIAPQKLAQRYNLTELIGDAEKDFEQIAISRGFLFKGGKVDYERCAQAILDDFRKGRIGKITIELPSESFVR